MASFQVSYMSWVGAWWWTFVDDHGKVLFTSPLSFDTEFEAFTKAVEVQGIVGQPTEVVIITKSDNEHILI